MRLWLLEACMKGYTDWIKKLNIAIIKLIKLSATYKQYFGIQD